MAEFDGHFGDNVPPFQEAVDWFLAKRIIAPEELADLSAALRAKAFTVARVFAADELLAVYDALREALEKGLTLWEFTKAVGEILPRAWHRETVFRTNILSSYGAGHWEQAQKNRALRPYGRYSAVMDGRTRPSHARLHGLVYPLDHAFWQSYWPPWDYNCRCGVVTLSEWEIEEEGLTVSYQVDGLPAANPKFQSPARGSRWEADYAKYPPELGERLREAVKAIYD